MNISGIYSYAGFYDTGFIKARESLLRQPEEAAAQNAIAPQPENTSSVQPGIQMPGVVSDERLGSTEDFIRNPGSDAVTYAKQYRPGAEYNMAGADRDMEALDIEKVMSDMKRDQVLEQYQYFVGEDLPGLKMGAGRMEENFLL